MAPTNDHVTTQPIAPPIAQGGEAAVSIRSLTVDYEREGQRVRALHNLDLTVQAREFLAVVGPSGCGKSTLLNVLVGTLQPSGGEVAVGGVPVTGINRAIGYVTQEDNLLPWRTLIRNITLPLELRNYPKAERRRLATDF